MSNATQIPSNRTTMQGNVEEPTIIDVIQKEQSNILVMLVETGSSVSRITMRLFGQEFYPPQNPSKETDRPDALFERILATQVEIREHINVLNYRLQQLNVRI